MVDDRGCKVYSTHKTRKDAEADLALRKAVAAWANGWHRLTAKQKELLLAANLVAREEEE